MERKKKSILVSKRARIDLKTLPKDVEFTIQKFMPASFAAKRYVTQELLFQERIRKLIKKINEGKDNFEKLPEEIREMIREEIEEGRNILEKNRPTQPRSRRRRRSPSPGRSLSPSRSPSRRRRRHN